MMTSGALLLLALGPVVAYLASAMLFSGVQHIADRFH